MSITERLRDCTVKIVSPNSSIWGTGFFVGYQTILTCCHVVKSCQPEAIDLQRNRKDWKTARLLKVVHRPVDLALLHVDVEKESHPPCVLLGTELDDRALVSLYGYPDELPEGSPCSGEFEGMASKDGIDLIQFKAGNVRPGHSGSPLLNEQTQKVCGVVRISRGRNQAMGGLAIPMAEVLKQFPELQDINTAFHQQHSTMKSLSSIHWTNPNQGKLRRALIAVYPDVPSLRQFVKDDIDELRVSSLPGENSRLDDWAEALVTQAMAKDWIDELYQVLCDQNPDHSQVQQLKQELEDC